MATIPLPSRRSRLAVATIFFVNGAVLASWVAHIPGVKERRGIGDGSLGFVLLFMALGAVLALPLGGWLVDRFGSRLITSLAALVICLALPWPLLSRDVTFLVTALVLLGACNAVLDVLAWPTSLDRRRVACWGSGSSPSSACSPRARWETGAPSISTTRSARAARPRPRDSPHSPSRWPSGGSAVTASPTASARGDRKSTRLNSSHGYISYAVFCLKKKKKEYVSTR